VRLSQQPAFVLHARPWRETSLLLELFTRDQGRVGAVARGVRGPRKQPLRAALQPFVPIAVDYAQRGELAQLNGAEPRAGAAVLVGDRLMAGLYLNELVLRLLPRGDAHAALFERYAHALTELAGAGSLAWCLRRFERDLLEQLGFAPPWREDSAGASIAPDARYRLDAESGPLPVVVGGVSGVALLALVHDIEPDSGALRELRDALRQVIATHLDGRPLKSWGLLARLPSSRVAPADPDSPD